MLLFYSNDSVRLFPYVQHLPRVSNLIFFFCDLPRTQHSFVQKQIVVVEKIAIIHPFTGSIPTTAWKSMQVRGSAVMH